MTFLLLGAVKLLCLPVLCCASYFCVIGNSSEFPIVKQKPLNQKIQRFALGYKDSNLEMTESESVALPFGDSPSVSVRAACFASHSYIIHDFFSYCKCFFKFFYFFKPQTSDRRKSESAIPFCPQSFPVHQPVHVALPLLS